MLLRCNVKQPLSVNRVVTQDKRRAAADSTVAVEVCDALLKVLMASLAGCFARIEPRRKAGQYLRALMSDLGKRNGWTIGEWIGDTGPAAVQRLLSRAVWDHDRAMSAVRRFAVAGLDERGAPSRLRIGALDETGQVKKGKGTAGVQRQHMGCADGVANGINTVHLAYVVESVGHALIAHRLWIPAFQLADAALRQAMGLPASMRRARAKGRIAIDLLAEAYRDGVVFDFICGDEVYGGCTILRAWLERIGQAYVLRVKKTHVLDFGSRGRFTCDDAVKQFASARWHWRAYSAGQGSKGERAYAWYWFDTALEGHTLLVRKHRRTGKLAFHYCYLPPGQQVTLRTLIRAAGLRWPVEESFEHAKDDFGLDQSQVRTWTAIRRHTILVAAALAVTAVSAARLRTRSDRRAPGARTSDEPRPAGFGAIPLTVPEIRRLWAGEHQPIHTRQHRNHWSAWRRQHQACAQWYHQRRNLTIWNEFHEVTT
jgi:SRSO17 transposase